MTKEQLRKNWRRGFAVALTAAMVANSTLPSATFAAEFTAPDAEEEISLQDDTQTEESIFDDGTQNAQSAENSEEDFSSGNEESLPEKEVQDGDFSQTKTVDGIEVSVTADEGVFPEGVSLNVRKVKKQSVIDTFEDAVQEQQETSADDTMMEEIREELEKLADQGMDDFGVGTGEENDLQVFDITITDENGEEIQPDNSKGPATVSFSGIDTDNTTEDIQIYHAEDDLTNVQALDTDAYVETGYAEATAEHFSYYCLSTLKPGTQFEIHELTSAYANTELTTGIYYVSDNTPEFVGADSTSSSQAGGDGLKIANGATVYIYVPDGKTLTATGGSGYTGADGKKGTAGSINIVKGTTQGITYTTAKYSANGAGGAGGSGATGGGAGIYVPNGSKIAILGNGFLNATGGTGGKAGNGQKGQNTLYYNQSWRASSYGSSVSEYSTTNNIGLTQSFSGKNTYNGSYVSNGNIVIGGAGGSGGGGAAGGGAGIGTNGANGNVGANGVAGNYDSNNDDYVNKVAGNSATAKIAAKSSGQIYIGNVIVNATGGLGGSAGSQQEVVSKHEHSITYYVKNSSSDNSGKFWVQDGQSGGGGGAGGTGASIGNGGQGGQGGAGGDAGSCWTKDPFANKNGYAPESVRGANGAGGSNGSGSNQNLSDDQNPYNTITFTGATSNGIQKYYLTKETEITIPSYNENGFKGWKVSTGAQTLDASFGTSTTKAFLDGDITLYTAGSKVKVDKLANGNVTLEPVISLHEHTWTSKSEGNVIKVWCTSTVEASECDYQGEEHAVSLTLNVTEKTYDGTPVEASVENKAEIEQLTNQTVSSVVYYQTDAQGNKTSDAGSTDAPKDAGTYLATVTLDGATAEQKFTIAPFEIKGDNVTLDHDSFVWDGTEKTPKVIVSVSLNNAAQTLKAETDYDLTGTLAAKELSGTDGYSLTVTGKGNYTGTVTKNWKITKRSMQGLVSADNVNAVYDGKSHGIQVSVDDSVESPTITYSLSENGTYTQNQPECITVGTHTVYYKVTQKNHEDYIGSATVTVAKRTISVAGITADPRTYDGTTDAVLDCSKAVFSHDKEAGIISGEEVGISATGKFTDANAGTDKKVEISGLKLTGKNAENYQLAESGNQTETKADILKKTVTFTWKNTNPTYNESAQSVTAEVSNKIDSDTFNLKYEGNTETNAGNYTAQVTGLGNDNYVIDTNSNASTDWSIAKAASKYTTTPAVISELTYNGADQTLITAGQTSDGTMKYKVGDGEWTTELPVGKNAGTYQVSYKVFGDKNHNDSKEGELSVKIAKAKVTVTPDVAEKHVGFDDPKLTSTKTGLVNGEELNGVVLTREKGEKPGTYKITAKIKTEADEDANPNYDVELKTGTFTINDHIWPDKWTVVREATAWSEGKEEKQCTYKDAENNQCGQKKYESIPKKGEEDKDVGKLEKDAEVAPDAPIDNAFISNSKTELLKSPIFSEKEKNKITGGNVNARVWIEVTPVDTKTDLKPEEIDAIQKEAEKLTGKGSELVYFNADMFKQIGNGEKKSISDPGTKIKLTISIPEKLLNHQSNTIRDYKIIRMHDGKAEVLSGTFNSTTKEFTFETDKFSTYAISYKDTYYAPSYPVTGVTVSPEKATLTKEGETVQLKETITPSYADNKNVTWKSSDEKVATVDKNGKVTAVANGTATITVISEDGKYTAKVTVTVKIAPEKLTLKAEKTTLTKIGDSLQITAKVEPDNAYKKLIWKSSDEKIAIVDSDGKVTAVGTGTATITATTEDGKLTESVTITVKIPDEPTVNETTGYGRLKARSVTQTNNSIKLEWTRVSGADGYIIYGNYCNGNGKTYKYNKITTITNGKTRTWTHTKLKKATYYKYIVKAYKLVNGKKVITDTSVSVHATTTGGKYGAAKAVSITKIGNKKNVTKVTLKKGKTAQITAKEIKKDRPIKHHRNICYESSNTKVAAVTPDGMIQAKGKGTCTIWVYAQNGVYKAVTVTVK